MRRVGFVSNDKKLGSAADQRALIGDVDAEFTHDEIEHLHLLSNAVIVIAHARAFGAYKGGFKRREKRLVKLSGAGLMVEIAGQEPVLYDTPERRALFHAAALLPTGRPSPKQAKNPGRPKLYREPETDDQIRHALMWWAQPPKRVDKKTGAVSGLSDDEVGAMVQGMMGGGKPASRQTLTAWFGGRRAVRQVVSEGSLDGYIEVVRKRIEEW